MSDFWTEMLDDGDSKSQGDGERERSDATERQPRFRLPSLPRIPRVKLPSIPSLPRVRMPSFGRGPESPRSGSSGDSRNDLLPFLSDLPGVAMRRWPAMLFAFAVGLAATFWILAGAQLLYRAEATVLVTRSAAGEGQVALPADREAIERIGATLDAVLSDETLLGLIDLFGLYSESGDAQPAALVDHMLGRVEVEPLPRLARSEGGEAALAYGFSFAGAEPDSAAAVANALAARFQELVGPATGDGEVSAARSLQGDARAAGEGAADPETAELARLKEQLRSAQDELARLNDREAGGPAAAGGPALEVSILDPAVPPTSPQRTRTVVVFAGLLASLLMAAGVACLLELVDPALLNAAQLARYSDAPVLGSLPRVA